MSKAKLTKNPFSLTKFKYKKISLLIYGVNILTMKVKIKKIGGSFYALLPRESKYEDGQIVEFADFDDLKDLINEAIKKNIDPDYSADLVARKVAELLRR